jgi:hypothetical protein
MANAFTERLAFSQISANGEVFYLPQTWNWQDPDLCLSNIFDMYHWKPTSYG